MESNMKVGKIIGTLFIIGTVSGILSVVFIGTVNTTAGYLVQIAANSKQFIIGTLLILLMGFSLAFIPIILYPILKKYNSTFALGYVVFRGALETLTYIAIWVSLLILLHVAQNDSISLNSNNPGLKTLGYFVVKCRELCMLSTILVFSIGTLLFYTVLYQSKLVPYWLSIWGLIAIVLHLLTAFLILFGFQTELSWSNTVLEFPIFLQEMVMAVWLIVKGFNTESIDKKIEKYRR